MNSKDEYTPEQIFKLYQQTELDQSTAANYLAFQKKWKKRELAKMKALNTPNLQEIEGLEESIEIIQDYLDIVLDYWIREDDPTLQDRIQLNMNNADITRFFKALKSSDIIECSAADFSKHFTNIKGEQLKAGFVNSLGNAKHSSNKLVEVIEKYLYQDVSDKK